MKYECVLYIARSTITFPRTRTLWPFGLDRFYFLNENCVIHLLTVKPENVSVCLCRCVFPLCGAPITRINSLNSFNMLLLRAFVNIPFHRLFISLLLCVWVFFSSSALCVCIVLLLRALHQMKCSKDSLFNFEMLSIYPILSVN